MTFVFDARSSDSSFIETIWRTQSERAGSFTSLAASQWEMVVTIHPGNTTLTVRGPETKATPAHCPADAEFFGIVFRLGTFMPYLPLRTVMDRRDLNLPEATSKSFWFHGSAWQFPDYDNADTFVDRLVRHGLLAHDPVVNGLLQDQPYELSVRTLRRRFLRATGLTHSYIRQIERARHATILLKQGVSILDTVYEAGYFDQSHLTRSLKHFVGQTPAQIIGTNGAVEVSLLYKTEPSH
jgi:AraC-like DNA-binding protein